MGSSWIELVNVFGQHDCTLVSTCCCAWLLGPLCVIAFLFVFYELRHFFAKDTLYVVFFVLWLFLMIQETSQCCGGIREYQD